MLKYCFYTYYEVCEMTIQITKLSHDGRGVARDNAGKTIFIDGVLPGEDVSYTITRSKRRFSEGFATEISNPSDQRVAAKCAHFLTCGGCAQQHISTEAQMSSKQQSLMEQLQHFGQVQPEYIAPPLMGPSWGYRNKARLGVRYVIKKEKVLVGFRERYTNYLAELDQCEVLNPKIGLLITPLRELIGTLEAYKEIAQLEVAVGDERMAIIVRNMVTLSSDDRQKLIDFAILHDFDLYLQPGKPDTVHKIWPEDGVERLYYALPAYNLNLAFYPLDFTQINPELNRKMIAQAIYWMQLNSDDHVLDLFCGLGNFTLAMATIAASVNGVEGSNDMVKRGYENAQSNNISNANFYAADLTTEQGNASWSKQKYTKVLIDPPRSGAAEVLPLLASFGVDTILYVSCNPATLARDSGILTQQYGYKLSKIGMMDMFPHTLHVETMALFVK